MQQEKEMWKNVLNILEREVTAVSFDLWLKTLEPLTIKDNVILLAASSETAKNQCIKNHSTTLRLAIKDVFNDLEDFKILGPKEKLDFNNDLKNNADESLQPKVKPLCVLNKKYNFESFVVGKSNQFVYAASKAVAESPSSKYNPLFIYGGVGLGKTHLMHAVGNYLNLHRPDLKVLYVTCEKFTNDYIDSLRSNNKEKSAIKFREKYRNLDILMVDDMQFISNKIETQEEFFHTFNDLYDNNKQIIIASDRHPREIATLSDRLRSRFARGLIQDIQKPNFETRVAILQKKAQQERYNISPDVITFLAEQIDSNIREMEGILSKVWFYANLLGKPYATMEEATEALKDQLKEEATALTPQLIIEKVCAYYRSDEKDLIGKSKKKEIVNSRQISIYLITELLDLPLVSIGKIFGGRDHTTIIHSRDKILDKQKTNPALKRAINDIRDMILGH